MIKAAQIKEFAKKNSLRFEEHFAQSYCRFRGDYFDQGSCNYMYAKQADYEIGLEMKSGVWFWWTACSIDTAGYDENLWFRNRYNQNNGYEVKAVMTGIRAEIKIMDGLK